MTARVALQSKASSDDEVFSHYNKLCMDYLQKNFDYGKLDVYEVSYVISVSDEMDVLKKFFYYERENRCIKIIIIFVNLPLVT